MIFNVRRNVQIQSAVTIQGQYESLNCDRILFQIRNPSSGTKFDQAAAEATKVVVMYRKAGEGDQAIVKTYNFMDVLKFTDYYGGRGLDTNDLDMITAILDLGDLKFGNGEKLNVDFTPPATTFATGVTLTIDMVKTSNIVSSPATAYESFTADGGEFTAKKALEIYQMSTPSGQILDVKDGRSAYSMSDYSCKALANASGKLENLETDIGLIWVDPDHVGRDVVIKCDAGTRFFVKKVA